MTEADRRAAPSRSRNGQLTGMQAHSRLRGLCSCRGAGLARSRRCAVARVWVRASRLDEQYWASAIVQPRGTCDEGRAARAASLRCMLTSANRGSDGGVGQLELRDSTSPRCQNTRLQRTIAEIRDTGNAVHVVGRRNFAPCQGVDSLSRVRRPSNRQWRETGGRGVTENSDPQSSA